MNGLSILFCAIIIIGTFLAMEGVAWFSHKYIMHGFLWTWHRSHHRVHTHTFERNDLFAVVFSIPAMTLMVMSTTLFHSVYVFSIGIGIICYGIFYFVFHDVIVHQRIKWLPKKRGCYLQRMIHAHYIHHSKHTKENCEAFGFLYAPKKFEPKKFVLKKERTETQ